MNYWLRVEEDERFFFFLGLYLGGFSSLILADLLRFRIL